jgi:hypothetical protein
MSYLDMVMVAFITPCLIHKSARASALVLLLVFVFYYVIIATTNIHMVRFMLFGALDTLACMSFLHLTTTNIHGKIENCLATLSASAVIFHFLGWTARVHSVDNTFYVNACIIIVIAQVSMLYIRLLANGILKGNYGGSIFRWSSIFNDHHGNQLKKKM